MKKYQVKFTIWAASCIAFGLLLAYLDGASVNSLIGSAAVMASLICAVLGSFWAFSTLKKESESDQ